VTVEPAAATKQTYAGLFMVTLATLMFEILLTRIFSVTMWYHYAFMAISIALFGMTVGAVLVYLRPRRFRADQTKRDMTLSALWFAAAIVLSAVVHLSIPITIPFSQAQLWAAGPMILTYVLFSIPFVFSGVCVTLALTRFPKQVSTLYAVDLAGAACGCIVLIYTLNATDGPTTVIVTALLAGAGALCFATETRSATMVRAAAAATVLLGALAGTNAILASHHLPALRLTWVKIGPEAPPLYEKWNSFSRVTVSGDATTPSTPLTWGLSRAYPPDRKVRQVQMTIDSMASTVITAFNGNTSSLDYLKYDVTNIVHYIKRNAGILVIGSGGGRDILSALTFGQRSVVAVEINRDIINALNRKFGDFSGHLDRDPRVTFVNDEARSYVARTPGRFDIIQLSLVDTAAATAAGAYVLTENSLYTVEAWTLLLQRLNPDGVLSVSRWSVGTKPGELYKVTGLASTALRRLGIEDPRGHIVVVRRLKGIHRKYGPMGMATILVGRAPFSPSDLATLEGVARQMRFDVVLGPHTSLDSTFATLASGRDLEAFTRTFPMKIAPPTDDSPFFFDMVRLRDVFHLNPWTQGTEVFNTEPVLLLVVLLIAVALLTLACIVVPLTLTSRKDALRGTLPLFVLFASIGVGFMMVEISQMQRLIIFLGHPTYGLSVVLFTLLLSSGLGSLVTRQVPADSTGAAMTRFAVLLGALLVCGAATPYAAAAFRGATTPLRILVAVAILFPPGVFMGMAFPLGMKLASASVEVVTPWLWGVNGATSVCASVLAVAISMAAGISASFWTGVGCYAVAVAAFGWGCQGRLHSPALSTQAVLSPTPVALSGPGE